ncbi:hypothetical protein UFOVP393_95 [uncultured Caudovirales phage]|jgi:regulator of replication initiation timing|uniref:Uncharacterized protein n=1 Tax=uncultured Caudovirales phage TaxID=2100421 RepID=A0A6J7X594_9CAUD|nr:hypothetical protein UFOVP393_95 [uncultured Caudovirales phage]
MTEEKKPKRARKADEGATQGEVNWEKLAKHLQEALESAIKENVALTLDNTKLIRDNIKLIGIVNYLESKVDRSNYSV